MKNDFNLDDVKGIVQDIGVFLQQANNENKELQEKILNEKIPKSIIFNQ